MDADHRKPLYVTPSEAKRLSSSVKRTEQAYQADQRRGRVSCWNPGVVRAIVTTAVPTGMFDGPSSTGAAQIIHKDQSGAWVNSGSPVRVFNDHTLTASIAVDKVVKLGWCDGDWYLLAADC